jgi:probable phosphomutase (TIGR03848 family)
MVLDPGGAVPAARRRRPAQDRAVTTFVLIRHALHLLDAGRIAGRMPGVHLSPAGLEQAARLPQRLAEVPLDAVCCSPIERAMETARPLAEARGIEVQTCEALLEIDYGAWTGQSIGDLRDADGWAQWNSFRSGRRVPDGESMLEIQARVVGLMLQMHAERPEAVIALVSHGDVIKAALAWALGTPLDLVQRIEVATASVSVVVVADHGPWVLCANVTEHLGDLPPWGAGL